MPCGEFTDPAYRGQSSHSSKLGQCNRSVKVYNKRMEDEGFIEQDGITPSVCQFFLSDFTMTSNQELVTCQTFGEHLCQRGEMFNISSMCLSDWLGQCEWKNTVC